MAVTGNTQTSAVKNDIIAAMVQKELISRGVLAPTVLDVSRFAGNGMKSISFPKAGSFTVENRTSGAAATTQSLTFAADKLDLEFRATVAWLIDSMDALQSAPDIEGEYAVRAAAAHAVYIEQKIIAKMASVGVETTTAGDLTKAIVLEMRQILLTHKANKAGISLAIGPDQEAKLLAISEFVEAYKYGESRIPTGALGMLFGVPVFVSTELAAGQYFMYDREGVAIGFQRAPMLDERPAPEYGAGSKLKVLDQLFGVQGLQLGLQGVSSGLSALVVKNKAVS